VPDPRITPANDRVTARWCAADHPALRAVDPVRHYVSTSLADLRLTMGGARARQLIYGAAFEVLEIRDGAAFGWAPGVQHAGWVPLRCLKREDRTGPSARVTTRQTHAYAAPDLKSGEVMALSHGSRVNLGQGETGFVQTEIGWLPERHVGAADGGDVVGIAEMFLGAPYLWGGNSAFGIDCSGLVQAAFTAIGQSCPADSDLQEAALGVALPPQAPPRRGDLWFWRGHVAMVVEPGRLIHANGFHMAVTYEGAAEAEARIEAQGGGPVTGRRRVGPR